MEKKRVSIIGFGRMGPILTDLLRDDFEVDAYDIADRAKEIREAGAKVVSLEQALANEVIFYAVPMSGFEKIFLSHLPKMKENHGSKLIVDLLSVKVFPKEVFVKNLPEGYRAMLTHPMFGPRTLTNKKIVIDSSLMDPKEYSEWEDRFTLKGLAVINMEADEHDRLAARSQALSHFIGRSLDDFGLEETLIDTLGTKKLLELKNQICSNNSDLFNELQNMNPYAGEMRASLAKSFKKINQELKAWKI